MKPDPAGHAARVKKAVATPGLAHGGTAAVEDGPAAQVQLGGLARLPWFLRLVRDEATGRWDALDLLEDAPRQGERVYLYRQRSWVHARGHGYHAAYRHVPLDASEAVRLYDTKLWREFVAELAQRDWPAMGEPDMPDAEGERPHR